MKKLFMRESKPNRIFRLGFLEYHEYELYLTIAPTP